MTKNSQGEKESFELVSIVVPAYKEVQNLRPLIKRIADAMSPLSLRYEIIVVDDDSKDGTDGIISELISEGHPVSLITRRSERGLSSAVIRGFKESKGEILVCMDADLSHPPEAIPKLLSQLCNEEDDFVIGSRYVAGGTTEENWGFLRWLNSKIATLAARPFTNVKDPMSGFFATRRDVFERGVPLLNPIGYKIGLELIVKCGCRNIQEVPIFFAKRKVGQSKLNFKEQLNYTSHILHLFCYKLYCHWIRGQKKHGS
jgi:dolichol-phosphate mannosyltransferase